MSRLGVSVGFACSICAATPLTTAAAWLVPLRTMYGNGLLVDAPATSGSGWSVSAFWNSVLPCTDVDSMPTPPARRSGFALNSGNAGPRELNEARRSSSRTNEPFELFAPTVNTHGKVPGSVMPPHTSHSFVDVSRFGCATFAQSTWPTLPAAATTKMLASTSFLVAMASRSP